MNIKDVKITKNFKYSELYMHNCNKPENTFQFLNLIYGCINILQPLRELFGPTRVTSGRRSRRYNKQVKGDDKSQHITGEAFDIKFLKKDADIISIYKYILNNLEFDQVILEKRGNKKWIHISFKRLGKNRKQALYSFKKGTYIKYHKGVDLYVQMARKN